MSEAQTELLDDVLQDHELTKNERQLLDDLLHADHSRLHYDRNFAELASAFVITKRLRAMADDLAKSREEAAAASRRHMIWQNVLTAVLAVATVVLAIATFKVG